MKKLLLLLAVLALAIGVQAQEVRMRANASHQRSLDSWVWGDYDPETGIVRVPTGQYLLYSEEAGYGISLLWGHSILYEDEEGHYWFEYFIDDDQIYTFDADSYGSIDEDITEVPYSLWSQYWNFTPTQVSFFGTIHGDDPIFEHRIGIQVYYTVNGVKNASDIVYINAGDPEPAVPADPQASYWYDYAEYGNNYGYFSYSLPTTDVNGNPIDQYYLSFSVFTDFDKPYVFKADDYPNDLTEDVTEIPSSIFFNSWNISNYSTYLYYDEAPLFEFRVGIQVHYTVNGETNSSNIVYLYIAPMPDDTGVSELTDGKQIADVRYYNLAGQQVAQPTGLTIQVTTYTDGTRTATKVIK